MLLHFFLLIFIIVSVSIPAIGQQKRFQPGLLAGINTSQIDGDNMSGFNKFGLFGGITISFPFSKKWSGHMEMLYIQKGSWKYYPGGSDSMYADGSWDELNLHYIEVPVYAVYKHSKRIESYFGIAGAKMFYFDFENSPNGQYTSYHFERFFTKEFSLLAGVYYHLSTNLAATGRLSYSSPIISNAGTGNLVLSLGFHYHLFPAKIK